jgi:hypothetical protein
MILEILQITPWGKCGLVLGLAGPRCAAEWVAQRERERWAAPKTEREGFFLFFPNSVFYFVSKFFCILKYV